MSESKGSGCLRLLFELALIVIIGLLAYPAYQWYQGWHNPKPTEVINSTSTEDANLEAIKELATLLEVKPIEGRTTKDLISDMKFVVNKAEKLSVAPLTDEESQVSKELLEEFHPETLKKIQATNDFVKKASGAKVIVLPK